MADVPKDIPSKGASSRLAWSEQDKIAYLLVLCEHAAGTANFESKTSTCPVPVGRTAESCRNLIRRLKDKHNDDMNNIKAGQPLKVAEEEGGTVPKTPSKRKHKVNTDADNEGSPKKKATGRKRANTMIKQEVKEEEAIEEELEEV
ncbi:hypothetical protein NX059_004850 [Plenodomus lindquistii]|nr:hypothetical protein NX059_004850 [Plenodomus lindquistii]